MNKPAVERDGEDEITFNRNRGGERDKEGGSEEG